MTTYQYLFANSYNGYYTTYRPFTSNKKLSQEDANKFMHIHNPIAGRLGSDINDLIIVANDNGYNIKPYKTEYMKDYPSYGVNCSYLERYDPLPKEFHDWEIINNISGNY